MRSFFKALLSFAVLLAVAGTAHAAKTKKKYAEADRSNSPSDINERQRNKETFDPSQYYQRDSNRIPFGTRTWWDQKTLEGSAP